MLAWLCDCAALSCTRVHWDISKVGGQRALLQRSKADSYERMNVAPIAPLWSVDHVGSSSLSLSRALPAGQLHYCHRQCHSSHLSVPSLSPSPPLPPILFHPSVSFFLSSHCPHCCWGSGRANRKNNKTEVRTAKSNLAAGQRRTGPLHLTDIKVQSSKRDIKVQSSKEGREGKGSDHTPITSPSSPTLVNIAFQ